MNGNQGSEKVEKQIFALLRPNDTKMRMINMVLIKDEWIAI